MAAPASLRRRRAEELSLKRDWNAQRGLVMEGYVAFLFVEGLGVTQEGALRACLETKGWPRQQSALGAVNALSARMS